MEDEIRILNIKGVVYFNGADLVRNLENIKSIQISEKSKFIFLTIIDHMKNIIIENSQS